MINGLLVPVFEEESHTYSVDGVQYEGVTTILRSCGIGSNAFWTQEGRDFGKAVHSAIHFYAQNDLDFDSLDNSIKPRLEAYIKFCADQQFRPDLIEQPLYHGRYKYCGTLDQAQIDRVVIDLKCGDHLPEHALQLSAYANMLPNPLKYERWVVHLGENGQYKIEPFKKQQATADFNVFLSALNVYNWRKNVGSRA